MCKAAKDIVESVPLTYSFSPYIESRNVQGLKSKIWWNIYRMNLVWLLHHPVSHISYRANIMISTEHIYNTQMVSIHTVQTKSQIFNDIIIKNFFGVSSVQKVYQSLFIFVKCIVNCFTWIKLTIFVSLITAKVNII